MSPIGAPGISIKKYPHFDALLTVEAAEALATNPILVAKHSFYPFIEYEKRWTYFSKKGQKGKEKCRLIRYAARRDSYIFSHYRKIISALYERKLAVLGMAESVIGYRRIKSSSGHSNKCNINFAHEAFAKVRSLGDCHVYALDISKFFENLDHAFLKKTWCDLLGVQKLPQDHYQVYKAVTEYACVNRLEVYENLGYLGTHLSGHNKGKKGYLLKREEIPVQLCNPTVFREKIAPLIKTNEFPCGVPQGAAISDVLSNLYLLDFDLALRDWLKPLGAFYYRYSDDILIVTPGTTDAWADCLNKVQSLITLSGNNLIINHKKCSAYKVIAAKNDGRQECTLVHETGCKNGIEYLGFRYDGQSIYLRESTRSNLNRAIVRRCRTVARSHVHHNPGMSLQQLRDSVNRNRVFHSVGRVEDFEDKAKSYKQWTFWTYARRCKEILGSAGRIYDQISGYRDFAIRKLDSELMAAFKKAHNP